MCPADCTREDVGREGNRTNDSARDNSTILEFDGDCLVRQFHQKFHKLHCSLRSASTAPLLLLLPFLASLFRAREKGGSIAAPALISQLECIFHTDHFLRSLLRLKVCGFGFGGPQAY